MLSAMPVKTKGAAAKRGGSQTDIKLWTRPIAKGIVVGQFSSGVDRYDEITLGQFIIDMSAGDPVAEAMISEHFSLRQQLISMGYPDSEWGPEIEQLFDQLKDVGDELVFHLGVHAVMQARTGAKSQDAKQAHDLSVKLSDATIALVHEMALGIYNKATDDVVALLDNYEQIPECRKGLNILLARFTDAMLEAAAAFSAR